MLGLEPAGSHSELDAPSGDVVRGHDELREHRCRAERHRRDQRSEPDPLGARGEGREGRPGVERARRRAAQERAVVIREEDGVEPRGLGRERQREQLAPLDPLLTLEHEAYAHAAIQPQIRRLIEAFQSDAADGARRPRSAQVGVTTEPSAHSCRRDRAIRPQQPLARERPLDDRARRARSRRRATRRAQARPAPRRNRRSARPQLANAAEDESGSSSSGRYSIVTRFEIVAHRCRVGAVRPGPRKLWGETPQ